MGALRSILVPVDYAAGSRHALRRAAGVARSFGARLVVLHVVPPYEQAYFQHFGVAAMPGDGEEEERRRLAAFAKEGIDGRNGVPWEAELAWGEPAEQIVSAAARRGCDLIVIGAGRRSVWDRLRIGSVAKAVVRKAACPVLVVPEEAEPRVAARKPVSVQHKPLRRLPQARGKVVRLAV